MSYVAHGTATSRPSNLPAIEVTNVSSHGLWVLLEDEELLLPFADFPWFRNATIGQIVNVEMLSDSHLHWPELDIDLDVDSIRHPENYPLTSRLGA